MSHCPPEAAPRSKYEVIFDEALKAYKKKTGKDLKSDPFLRTLEACKSPDETLSELRQKIPDFDHQSENTSDNRLTNWIDPVVNVLYIFAQTIGGAVGLAFQPGAVIFTGISSLLSVHTSESLILFSCCIDAQTPQVLMATRAVQSAIADLFESFKRFFIRLEVYVKLPQMKEMTDIIVDVMVHVLHILALLTKEIKQGKMKRFLKKLIGRSDIEDALRRFDRLTQEESRMVAVQCLKAIDGVGNDVRDVGDGVKVAINKVDAVLDGGEDMRVELQQVARGVGDLAKDASDEKRNQMRHDIEMWLSPVDPFINLNTASEAHYKGTAEWFTRSSAFETWKESGSLLWIHGKPGSGKSVLSSTIIQDINGICNTGTGHLAFFFFDFKDAGKQDARALLSSIIIQLSDRSVGFFDVLLGFYFAHGDGKQQPSISSLTQCLEDMLKVPEELPVHLIIDAIDECPNTTGIPSSRDRVLALLDRLVTLKLPNLRICVTSRPEADIRTSLEPLTSTSNTISLHDEIGQKTDIIEFVTSVVRTDKNMRRWREEDKELVIKTLSERADGMFRWVFCQLEMLRPCLPSSVRGILAELPETLDATYERILQEIPKPNRVHAHRLLQCLTVAVRPLAVEELEEVLAIDFDGAGGIPKSNRDFRWADQEQAVLSACSSLIAIVKDDDTDEDSRRVQFSHFSVKEFLSSDRLATSEMAALRFHHIHLQSAHAIMAQACLGVLLQLDDSMDKETIEGYPLAKYAGEFFNAHAEAGDVLSQDNDGVDHLLDPDKPHFNSWFWLQWGDVGPVFFEWDLGPFKEWYESSSVKASPEHPFPTYPPRVSPLYYTVGLRHQYLTRHLILKRPHDLETSDVYGRTPFHLAVYGLDFEATRMLLDRMADINVRDNRGCTPLHFVVGQDDDSELDDNPNRQDDQFRCVRLLLERGADAEAQDNRGTIPLHLAARSMSRKTVQMLTESVTNINLRNNRGQTALHKASQHGDPDIINIILNHGADVDTQDNGGETPLHLAISNPPYQYAPEQAIGVLLEHGANINLRSHDGQTALHRAVRRGNIGIMHIILKHGPDVNALDNGGHSALHLAIDSQDVKQALGLLLEHGANINLRDGEGQTVLHTASLLCGYPDVIRLILNHGTDVDAQDNDGSTALHLIIFKTPVDYELPKGSEASEDFNFKLFVDYIPHHEVIKLLLEHGASGHRENNRGETPFQVAAMRGFQGITELLSMHSERVNGIAFTNIFSTT